MTTILYMALGALLHALIDASDRANAAQAELDAKLADSPSAPPRVDIEHEARRLAVMGVMR